MAEEKESVEAVDLDAEPAVTGPGSNVDDDLLSDFDDLLGQGPDTGGQDGAQEPEVDLSELEAFLDDFSPGSDAQDRPATPDEPDDVPASADSADSADAAEHPVPLASEPEPTEPEPEFPSTDEGPQLAEDELDLSAVASDEPVKLDTPDFVPPDPVVPPNAPSQPAEVPPVAAVAPAAGDAVLPKKAKTPPLAAALALVALAVAGGAGYLAFERGTQVDALGQRIAMLESGAGSRQGADGQVMREIKRLEARLSELAIIIEGPMSHLRESNERDVRNLATRVNELEAELKAFMAAPPPSSAGATTRVPPPASGGWVVNVVSLSDRPTARQERQRLVSLGIDARLEDVTVEGKTWYRLQVAGFASKGEAQSYVDVVRRKAGLGGAWVTRD